MLDLEIRERLHAYIAGDLRTVELEDWLEDASWDATDEATQSLAATVLRLLSEHDNGDWTDDELASQLGHVSRIYWFDAAPKTMLTGTDAVFTRYDRSSPSAGTRHVGEPERRANLTVSGGGSEYSEKRRAKRERDIAVLETKLRTEGFMAKAPQEVIDATRERLDALLAEQEAAG